MVCPRCGTKLEFRARGGPVARPVARPVPPKPPAAPPKAAAPAASPARRTPAAARPAGRAPAPLPVAAPAIPLATPVTAAPAPSALAFGSKSDVVLAPLRRRRGLPGWLIALLLVVGVFGGVAVLVFGAILNGSSWGSHNSAGDASGPSSGGIQGRRPERQFPLRRRQAAVEEGRTAARRRRGLPALQAGQLHGPGLPRLPHAAAARPRADRRGAEEAPRCPERRRVRGQAEGRAVHAGRAAGRPAGVPGRRTTTFRCMANAWRWPSAASPTGSSPGRRWTTRRDWWTNGPVCGGNSPWVTSARAGRRSRPRRPPCRAIKLPYKLEYIKSVWEKQEGPREVQSPRRRRVAGLRPQGHGRPHRRQRGHGASAGLGQGGGPGRRRPGGRRTR